MDAETYNAEMDQIRAAIHRALGQANWVQQRIRPQPQRLAEVIDLDQRRRRAAG